MEDVGREDSGSAQDFSYRLLRSDHCLVAKSCLTLVTLWTVAQQAPLSVGFPRQEYWSGLPFPSLGDLLDPGIKPESPSLADSLPLSHLGSPC